MNRILAALLLVAGLCASAAAAKTYVQIHDSGIDYSDTDLSSAYFGLEYMDGELRVHLDDESFDGAMSAKVDFDVPDLVDRKDFFGNTINADITDIDDVFWTGVNDDGAQAHYTIGFMVTHLDTTLSDAIAEYDALLGTAGFNSSVLDTVTPAVKVVTFSNGEETLWARMTLRRGNVIVDLKSL